MVPVGGGDLAKPGTVLDTIAKKHHAAPSQIALAWVLKRSPVILPIPGTSKISHLEENVAAADIVLSDENSRPSTRRRDTKPQLSFPAEDRVDARSKGKSTQVVQVHG